MSTRPKTPTSLPPSDHVLLRNRSYHSGTPWVWHQDDNVLSLVPLRYPPLSHWLACLLLVPFASYFAYSLLGSLTSFDEARVTLAFAGVPALSILLVLALHLAQRKLGPWLHYDQSSGQLTLPRTNITLAASDIDHIQVTSGTSEQDDSKRSRANEVNVIVIHPNSTADELIVDRFGILGAMNIEACRAVAKHLEAAMGFDPYSEPVN